MPVFSDIACNTLTPFDIKPFCGFLVALNLWPTQKLDQKIDHKKNENPSQGESPKGLGKKYQAQRLYQSFLNNFLEITDRVFDGHGYSNRTPSTPSPSDRTQIWTANAYDRCLSLAVLYPIVASILVWVVFGYAGDFGPVLKLTDTNDVTFRAAKVFGTIMTIILFFIYKKRKKFVYLFLIIFAATLTFFLIPDIFIENEIIYYIIFSAIFSLIISFFFSTAFIVSIFFTLIGDRNRPARTSTNFMGVIMGIITTVMFLSTLDQLLHSGPAIYLLGYGLFVWIFIMTLIASGVIGAISGIVSAFASFSKQKRVYGLFVLLFSALAAFSLLSTGGLVASLRRPLWYETTLLAFALFPLVTAPLIWASLGFSRWLLRKAVNARAMWHRAALAFTDFVCALGFMGVLALALVGALEVFDAHAQTDLDRPYFSDQGLIDGPARLLLIQADPWDGANFWIYITLLLPLIPTILHAMIWCASVIPVQVPPYCTRAQCSITRSLNSGLVPPMAVAAGLATRWSFAIGAVAILAGFIGYLLLYVAGFGQDFLNLLLWWQAVVSGWLA